jgi:hypothetical protein
VGKPSLIFVLFFIVLTAQSKNSDKLYFIQKASSLLRNGHEIQNPKELKKLKRKSKSEIFDYLIGSSHFYDTVFHFNLYFLQFNPGLFGLNNRVISDYYHDGTIRFNEFALTAAPAIASVQELAKNGNYLSLLSDELNAYADIRNHSHKTRTIPLNFPTPQERLEAYQKLKIKFEKLNLWVQSTPSPKASEFCSKAFDEKTGPFPFYNHLRVLKTGSLSSEWYHFWDLFEARMYIWCAKASDPNLFNIKKDMQNISFLIKELEQYIISYAPENYKVYNVLDIQKHALFNKKFPFDSPHRKLSYLFVFTENTSTNYNRKRAAHILSTFFCDDLVPIGFVEPLNHSGGKHASDPGCMACHYKLDPMAGFFKDHGYQGVNFSEQQNITFSDLSQMDFKKYTSHWIDPSGEREWNIGFIRSNKKKELNEYGENMSDLFRIIQKAPEVKACLVNRMVKYFWGEEITVDSQYLKALSEYFRREAKINSSLAFIKTLKKIVLANSFTQKTIKPGECYDYVNGSRPENSPPCEINQILQDRCVQCHSSADVYPFLNLGSWKKNEFGELSFEHRNENGTSQSRQYTLSEIQKRISTNDPLLKMPKRNKLFTVKERETLYLWLEKKLGEK